MRSTIRRLIVLSLALASVAGCSHKEVDNCPGVSSLVETSIATVFRSGATTDPSNMLYTVDIEGLNSSCDVDKQAMHSKTNLVITFRAARAADSGAEQYRVPYFVAISQSDRIMTKKLFTVDFEFQPGETSTTFTDTIAAIDVKAGGERKTFDYEILAGLQLTRDQLQYNRTTNRLVP